MLEAYNHVLEIPTLTTNKELNQEPNITSINEGNPEKIKTMIPQIIITPPLEIITEDNKDVPQSSPNPITSEQSNLTTNNENINEHTVTKINHSFGINQNNPTIPEESSTEKVIILIEMTDKFAIQLRLENEKSVKSPTKQKSNTKKRKRKATIEMQKNLKNTINKIDNHMINIAKKYEQEQELINVKITDIIENLITPLKLENVKLKEASQNALDKIELLNTQTLDSNTLTKNKVKETKTAMENKFEEINTNIFNVKQSLKKLESKQKNMNNTEKNNNNINKQNLKITKEATTQTETQIEDKPPALFEKLAHNGLMSWVLCPILFINNIGDISDQDQCQPPSILKLSLNHLLYADDLVLISETKNGLQQCLNILQKYCEKNRITVNNKKTSVMIVQKRKSKRVPTNLSLADKTIGFCNSYTYLGSIISNTGNFKININELIKSTSRVIYNLLGNTNKFYQVILEY